MKPDLVDLVCQSQETAYVLSALVHMIVKSCKFGSSKYNWGDSFTFPCWVPWGTPLHGFTSLEAGTGRTCWVFSPHTCLDSMSCLSCLREWCSAARFAVRASRLPGLFWFFYHSSASCVLIFEALSSLSPVTLSHGFHGLLSHREGGKLWRELNFSG